MLPGKWRLTDMSRQKLQLIVVEDDTELRDILTTGLTLFGHSVRSAADGVALDLLLSSKPADILILDLGLPGENGLQIAERLRQMKIPCGIIMLTARGKLDERILGLTSGADHYFVKPVDIRELDAAIRSLSRRLSPEPKGVWRFVSRTASLVTPKGISVPLSAQECILLDCLAKTPGKTISRKEIFHALQQSDDVYADRRLETMISRLRTKVRSADPSASLPVRARHNLGYAFLADLLTVGA